MGIFIALGKIPVEKGDQGRRLGMLYADGYFARSEGNKLVKKSFITKPKHFKGLAEFADFFYD